MRRGEPSEAHSRGPPATPSPRASRRGAVSGTGGSGAAAAGTTASAAGTVANGAGVGSTGPGKHLLGMVPDPASNSNDSPRTRAVVTATYTGTSGKGKGRARGSGPASTSGNHNNVGRGQNGNGGRGVGGRSDSARSLDGGGNDGGNGDGNLGGTQEAGHEEPSADDQRSSKLDQLRALTKSCLEDNMAEAGAYYADKLVTFSGFDREDVLLLAKAQFACGAFLRTVHLLAQHRLLDYPDELGLRACHLAARSLHAAEKREESISLLEKVLGHTDADAEAVKAMAKATREARRASAKAAGQGSGGGGRGGRGADGGGGRGDPGSQTSGVDVLSALCCLRGQAYANLDNRPRAAIWLRTALEIDARCVEALQCLTRWHLLSIEEQGSMLPSLDYGEAKEESWLNFLYSSQLNRPPGSRSQVFADLDRVGLGANLDVLAAKAECCYEQNDAQQALEICRQVFRTDPHNAACLPVYLAAMVELKMKSQLFYTAHQLVEAAPKQAVSWFAVGCYYHLLGKNELAQRYFLKSTKLDGRFAPAWIGFGNAFAAEEETDQAVSAYRTAARLFQGSHLPLLYIGMEYVRTHNLALARNFLQGALALSPSDPLVLNELGVVHFAYQEYEQAAERFEKVLKIVEGLPSQAMEAWECTVFNLGHCHRKLGHLDKAAACYARARELAPGHHSPHSALALTHHLQGKRDAAISGYHRALGLKADDAFAAEMLKKALQESFEGDECTGLADLLSKTSLETRTRDANGVSRGGTQSAGQSAGQGTPLTNRKAAGVAGAGGAGGAFVAGVSRGADTDGSMGARRVPVGAAGSGAGEQIRQDSGKAHGGVGPDVDAEDLSFSFGEEASGDDSTAARTYSAGWTQRHEEEKAGGQLELQQQQQQRGRQAQGQNQYLRRRQTAGASAVSAPVYDGSGAGGAGVDVGVGVGESRGLALATAAGIGGGRLDFRSPSNAGSRRRRSVGSAGVMADDSFEDMLEESSIERSM